MSVTKAASNNGSDQNVYMAPLNDYEALFKIDLNFDMNVSEMDDTVLSDYITRVIQGHPYYVSLENVVDIIVDEESNKVTLIVSNKAVGDHIIDVSNNNTTEVNTMYNNVAGELGQMQGGMSLINAQYKDKKYIMETTNKEGEPIMYEYDFKGFNRAKSLYKDESIKFGNNRIRHFLKNTNGNPYFYDEYMNSAIVYSPEEKVNFLQKRVKTLENKLYDSDVDPDNVDGVRDMLQKLPIGNDKTKPTLASVNSSSTLLNNGPSTGSGMINPGSTTASISGVSKQILNNTNRTFQSNVNIKPSNSSTFRSLNDNRINNVNLAAETSLSSASLDELSDNSNMITTTRTSNNTATTRASNNAGVASTTRASNNAATTRASNNASTTTSSNNNSNHNHPSVASSIKVNPNNMDENRFKNVTMQITNKINSNNLANVNTNNINEEDLDNELKDIISNIKDIEKDEESKNYRITVGIILAILVLILVGVIIYFVMSNKETNAMVNNVADKFNNMINSNNSNSNKAKNKSRANQTNAKNR